MPKFCVACPVIQPISASASVGRFAARSAFAIPRSITAHSRSSYRSPSSFRL